MNKRTAIALGSLLLLFVGFGVERAIGSHAGTDFWLHCTNLPVVCSEATPPTTTVTVTTTQPTTTMPTPPPNNCTDILAAGGDLSTFLGSVTAGDVGCLRGGDYTDGSAIAWSGSSATLQSFPGETARVHTELHLNGPSLTVQRFTISNTTSACNSGANPPGCDGIRVSGSGVRILDMVIDNVNRHGILFHTSSSGGQVLRNVVSNTGTSGSTIKHGIYVPSSGHLIANNVIYGQRGGYGIQLFSSPSNVTVAQNTVADVAVRPGLVVNGSGNRVVNNIFENGWTFSSGSCSSCTIDRNLTGDPGFIDSLYRVGPASPAVDAARTDFSFTPAFGGVVRPIGAGPDIGAHERSKT
jgi:Right handed beta helix region